VEILSPSDAAEKLPLEEKLARFHAMGVPEVLVYNVEAAPGGRLQAWDLVQGDMVERIVENEVTPCRALGMWFAIGPCADENEPHALRLASDPSGANLLPTPRERDRQRIAELEAQLKTHRG
jgi:hypothetical protein